MGRRRNGPWFRKADQCYYTEVNGRQINLGKNYKRAEDEYHRLMAGKDRTNGDRRLTVAQVADEFLEWNKRNRSEGTYEWYLKYLKPFVEFIGYKLRVADLRPYHVDQWLISKPTFKSASTRHGAMRSVQRAMNWAVKQGYIAQSPVAGMEKPTPNRREVVVSEAQYQVEAKHFDGECWTFERKTSKGKKYNRVVYLNERALEITRRLAKQHRDGPLLKNRNGKPWDRNSLKCRFRYMKKKLDVDELSAGAFRHTWATRALKNGIDSTTASILMGHRDPATLARNYQHLARDHDHLKEQLDRLKRDENEEPRPGADKPEDAQE